MLSSLLLASALAVPQFYPHTVVSAASYVAGPIAPCEIISIFGAGLGPADPAQLQLSPDGRHVTSTLAGARVLFEGIAAPLLYVSASQVSVVVPCTLTGKASAQVQVEYLGVLSAPVTLPMAPAKPGIFTLDSSGRGPGAILNWPDNSVNRPGNTTPQGGIVSLYASAGGWVSPPAEDGTLAHQTLPLPLPVTATVGGLPAPVLYAGAAPGLVTGVLQVNLRIPLQTPPGDAVPVTISVNGVPSAPGVTLAIRPLTLASGYVPRAAAFKGQLHVHSTNSDGAQAPATVVQAYRDAGYHFISLTDHDRVTSDPLVPGILFLPGVEQSPNGNHLNRIGVPDVLRGSEQAVIDGTLAQGGFLFLNHPNWPGGYPANPNWTDAELESLRGFHGLEVWNAVVTPNNNAENRVDPLLARGRRFFLLATDDCHDIRNTRCRTASTWVFADRLEAADILHSLKSGNFYASSGAVISSITVSGRSVSVVTDRPATIDFIGAGERVLHSASHTYTAAYIATGEETHIRARVTRDSDSAQAWSNPLYPN